MILTSPCREGLFARPSSSDNANPAQDLPDFPEMGFQVYEAPDVETDEYNFQLLNIPEYHPARDMWDTFWVNDEVVLRTHTSPGQIRAMREYHPNPIRVILPGKCYRYEQITPRSEHQFFQVEGLAVGRNIRLTDLIGVMTEFAKKCGQQRQIASGELFPIHRTEHRDRHELYL